MASEASTPNDLPLKLSVSSPSHSSMAFTNSAAASTTVRYMLACSRRKLNVYATLDNL